MNLPVDAECSIGLPVCNLGGRHDIPGPRKDSRLFVACPDRHATFYGAGNGLSRLILERPQLTAQGHPGIQTGIQPKRQLWMQAVQLAKVRGPTAACKRVGFGAPESRTGKALRRCGRFPERFGWGGSDHMSSPHFLTGFN